MNSTIAYLNQEIAQTNDLLVIDSLMKETTENTLNSHLEEDFRIIKDAILKYFVYQTNLLRNIEYDANNIIKTLEVDDDLRKTVHLRQTPIKLELVVSAENDKYSKHISNENRTPSKDDSESNTFDGIEGAFSNIISFWNNSVKELKESFNAPEVVEQDIDNVIKRGLTGERKQMVNLLYTTRVLCQNHIQRQKAASSLQIFSRDEDSMNLDLDSFFSIKEIIFTVLNTCIEYNDFISAFSIIRNSQDYQVKKQGSNISQSRSMASYLYSHRIVKSRGFWEASITWYCENVTSD